MIDECCENFQSIPDHPSENYSSRSGFRNGSSTPSKMFIQEPNYHHHPGNSSAYSTLKDSCRSYKESSPPYSSSSCSTLKHRASPNYSPFSPSVNNINYIDEDIPYHARQTSQPFSYGATPEMIKHQKLSSPSLVRKASFSKPAPIVDLDEILEESPPPPIPRRPISPAISKTPPSPPPVAETPTPEPGSNRSFNNDGIDG